MSQPSVPVELVNIMRSANQVTVLTGAGISAESGIPTFREARTGLWEKYRPEELATPGAFENNPRLVWEWYIWRRELAEKAQPNPGHYALAAMERNISHFTLITQNVDGLHQRAGSEEVLELHGNIRRARCCSESTVVETTISGSELPPHCSNCGALLRPDVVWFGESLPAKALGDAVEVSETADLFFSIGTSGMVEPAASLPYVALRSGAVVVEINPEPTPLNIYAKFYLPYPAGVILPILVSAAWPGSLA